jgi:glutamate/tyrosine decarboxylase-like PLP-dependent enzyme
MSICHTHANHVAELGQWFASPACTELESVVMDWSAKMFGLDAAFLNQNETGGGVIQVRPQFIPSIL